MNKIGGLYVVKKYYWLLFSNKEAVAFAPAGISLASTLRPTTSSAAAASWSKKYNCNVSYFSPNDLVVLLEVDGEYKKLLSSSGEMGWTWFIEDFNDCFEEVNE